MVDFSHCAGSILCISRNPCVYLWLIFSRFIQFNVGDGTRVKFCHDLWCGDCPLKEAFLELYRIFCDKESSIAEIMHFPNGILHWDVQFSRSV